MVRARSTYTDPSPICSTVNFCEQKKSVLFVLKPSLSPSSGLGGRMGTGSGPATPKKISSPTTLSTIPPHRAIASLCCSLHHQMGKQPSNLGLCPVVSDTASPLQRLMGFILCILMDPAPRKALHPAVDPISFSSGQAGSRSGLLSYFSGPTASLSTPCLCYKVGGRPVAFLQNPHIHLFSSLNMSIKTALVLVFAFVGFVHALPAPAREYF